MESRGYVGPDDLQRMLDAMMAWRQAQPEADYQHVGDLLWAFRRQSQPERHVRLWEEAGTLAGFTMIDPAWGMVLHQAHPGATEPLRRELFDWGIERLRRAAHEEGGQMTACDQAREDNVDKIAFLEAEGFTRDDSSNIELLRPLSQPVPSPRLPEGFTVRHLAGEEGVSEYVDMHRDAWSVWGASSYSVEQHLRLMRHPGYTMELNPVVVAADGSLVSYCIGWLDPINKIGEIEPLGTRPDYARRGLARAVVTEVLQRMQVHGMKTALVYGTQRNPAAWDLYQSLEFQPGRKIYSYHRKL